MSIERIEQKRDIENLEVTVAINNPMTHKQPIEALDKLLDIILDLIEICLRGKEE